MNVKSGVKFLLIWMGVVGVLRTLFSGFSGAAQDNAKVPGAMFWLAVAGTFVVMVVGVVGWFLLPQKSTSMIADRITGLFRRLFGGRTLSLGRIVPSGKKTYTVGSGTIVKQYRMNYFDPNENSNKTRNRFLRPILHFARLILHRFSLSLPQH